MSVQASNPLRGAKADPEHYSFETFEASWPSEGVLNLAMDRPDKLNAQNPKMWAEIKAAFDAASSDPECRVVVLTGNGRLFTAGIDLQQSFVSDGIGKKPAAGDEKKSRTAYPRTHPQ